MGDKVPVDAFGCKIDRNPTAVMEIGRLQIGSRIGLEQHRLLIEAARLDADDGLSVPVMVIAKLGELLACDKEGRLTMGELLRRFGQFQRGFAHFLKRIGHRLTKSLNTVGYSLCSAASTRP